MSGQVDVVYTWVDDRFPGYLESLRGFARNKHDLNPNRTRDNLDLLKYSLRSLERFAPWLGTVHIVSMRPQFPAWLDTNAPCLSIVHHDEFIGAPNLPTFNSFAIVASLDRIAGVSERFLYLEDDQILMGPTTADDFVGPGGRIRVYLRPTRAPAPTERENDRTSPWNRALAHSNHLLDEAYSIERRRMVNYVPLLIDRSAWAAMWRRWPDVFEWTMRSRFRATGNAAPEFLYPHFLLNEGLADGVLPRETRRLSAYHGLQNIRWFNRIGLARLRRRRPKFLTLNDNFGERPNPHVVRDTIRYLDEQFPSPSRFER